MFLPQSSAHAAKQPMIMEQRLLDLTVRCMFPVKKPWAVSKTTVNDTNITVSGTAISYGYTSEVFLSLSLTLCSSHL